MPGLLLAGALALAGCEKDSDENVDLPETAGINSNYVDLPLAVATVQRDSGSTLKADHYLVGRLRDNVAGETEARTYANLLITSDDAAELPSLYDNPVLDSVVVVMGVDYVYGSGQPVKFDVYSQAARLDDRAEYNRSTLLPLGASLGSNLPSRTDYLLDGADTLTVPTIRLRLLNTVRLERLFSAMRASNFNQDVLDLQLPSLAITPSAGYSGSILSFGRSYNAHLAVYFHASSAPGTVHKYPLYFGPVLSANGRASAADPRYFTTTTTALAGTPLAGLANSTSAVDAATSGGFSYMQQGTGLATRLVINGLEQLKNRGLVINRAELRLPVQPYSTALYANPTNVFAIEADANNQPLERVINFTPVERVVQADGASQTGANAEATGTLINGSTARPYYTLLISSYLQAYIDGQLDGVAPASLLLVPAVRRSTNLTLGRSALEANNIRLRVYYSQVR